MIAREMRPGFQYKIENKISSHGCQVVEYSHPSNTMQSDQSFACVHERGELDFQSLIGVEWGVQVEPMPDTVAEDRCPACGRTLERTNNPHNPVCRQNNSFCRCGWMGNYVP